MIDDAQPLNVEAWLRGQYFTQGLRFQSLWKPMRPLVLPRLDDEPLDTSPIPELRSPP